MKDLGMMGQMFKGIIFTIVIALCSSLLVAIFLVPVLAGKFLPLTNRKEKPVKSRIMKSFYGLCTKVLDAITKVYSRILKKALEYRAVTIIIAVCLLVIAISLLPTLGMNMMPQGNDDSVTLSITLPIGTPLEDTRDVSLAMEQIVRKEIPSFEKLITTVGGGGRNANTYKSSIQITLNKDSGSAVEVQNKLRKYFTQFPGAKFSFGAGTRGQMMGSDIDIALRSDDLDEALSVADKIVSVMEDISALGDITIDTEEGLPQVEIEIDRERAYSFGVDVSTVAKEINYAVNGVTSTTYRQAGKDYDVTVMYQPSDRENIIDLETMYVSGTGGKVSLSNFATLKKGLGPVSIKRENQRRIVHITASILTSDNANLVEDAIKEGIANTFIVPDNVSVSYEGSWQDTNEQMKLYSGILIMAILLVFGVMAATYESFKAPLINLATIPFLLIGVVFLYKIIGQPLSIMAMVGLIMLVGIVVNNGIILVDYTNLLRNRNIPMMEACFQAGVSRLRPVLMTTLTTILGMIPMCFASEGQSAMVQPIGIAVVGGLTSSTFVTLLVIPVLYSLVMKDEKKLKSRIKVEYDLLDEKSDIEDKE